MTTTAALLHTDMTVTDAQNRFIDAAQTAGLQVGHEKLATLMATPKFTAALDHATAQMARRQPRLQD
jgi:hypothetical protein